MDCIQILLLYKKKEIMISLWCTNGGVSTAASLYIYLCFFRNRSGGEPGTKDPVTTETPARKYIGLIHFTGKHETQRLGHSDSMGCVWVSTSYTLMH